MVLFFSVIKLVLFLEHTLEEYFMIYMGHMIMLGTYLLLYQSLQA